MRDLRAVAVMQALSPDDADTARFVGGCVRNALMGIEVDDVDIATTLTPDEVTAALEAAKLRAVPTGVEHGTVTAVSGGKPYEITTLRKDVETFGRRAVVAYTTDWAEDAARRDFRLNAIYARPDGTLFDPFDGATDAAAGRIVFIGEARERIAEDFLRILRFYRFNAWYGRTGIDPEGQAACVAMRSGLTELSAERVWKELKKLLAAPDPRAALAAMQEGHVLDELVPGPLDFDRLVRIIVNDIEKSRPPDPVLRVAALAGGGAERVDALCTAMKVSKAERARLEGAATAPRVAPGLDDRARRAALYRLGSETFSDQIRLSEAEGEGDPARAEADLAAAKTWERPAFPVRGADLKAMGYKPGPAMGAALDRLKRAWIESDFSLDREALLAMAREPDS
ncbi:CCA tRNA nucleotidyltransferase [Marinicauda salina]|uniref:CCA tRNA nucleotidyltransferase n=2 Tax=Marinicauda salina TaxID=2135793 RepID=A0A2U2BS79_9PROT|nr:CCA tRNA nucleotidyltransferase [Marinicauda salina]